MIGGGQAAQAYHFPSITTHERIIQVGPDITGRKDDCNVAFDGRSCMSPELGATEIQYCNKLFIHFWCGGVIVHVELTVDCGASVLGT